MLDSTFDDPQQMIADLRRALRDRAAEREEALAGRDKAERRLAERTAERDAALEIGQELSPKMPLGSPITASVESRIRPSA
jgi:hypothetical protein